MSSSESPLTFLDLPTELKCRIMTRLDLKSLLNMRLTSKLINEVIYASEFLILYIEMAKSELLPMINIRSTPMARKFLKAHLDARLNLPVATRPCVVFPAPKDGIRRERLFRGLLACITNSFILHVWDIRRPDPTQPPNKILFVLHPDLIDVVIEPDYNLLVVLSYRPGDNIAMIKMLDLKSRGTRTHPWASSPLIIHRLLPGDSIDSPHGEQHLALRGELLSFVYYRDARLESRRGIVWAWMTGSPIYDSMDFRSSSDFHDLLLLPTPKCFLVTVSTFLITNPKLEATPGAWIELRYCGPITTPTTSQLIAEFHLPEFAKTAEHYMGAMNFYASEPPNGLMYNTDNEDIFPFVSNPATSVQVLNIWYKPRPEAGNEDANRVYLVISNRAFVDALLKWVRQSGPNSDTPFLALRYEWDEWAPAWTSAWNYEDLGLLSESSSVCGSRICTVTNPYDDAIELQVADFNMNFPCSQWTRNCPDPSTHFSPRTLYPGSSPWARMVRTWLPYHLLYKGFKIQREDDQQLVCTTVLMDEERIVFSTCVDEDHDFYMDPTSWKVVHLVRDEIPLGGNCFTPEPDEEDMDVTTAHDQICRMCKEKPHTDAHILFECAAIPKVVDLRRKHLAHYDRELQSGRSFDELCKDLMTRRGPTRIPFLTLAGDIYHVYLMLPSCSEIVPADQENPASILFTSI